MCRPDLAKCCQLWTTSTRNSPVHQNCSKCSIPMSHVASFEYTRCAARDGNIFEVRKCGQL